MKRTVEMFRSCTLSSDLRFFVGILDKAFLAAFPRRLCEAKKQIQYK